jgi:membrane-associated phospholipid phosphatase
MIGERHLDAGHAAWLTTVSSVALADAFISAWGYKFRLNLIRPRTFIRQTLDPNWEPFIPTPPFPEYLSGHSTVSGAVAGVLTGMLGTERFEDSTSVSLGHKVRTFASFSDAAAEAGMSRIYGGIHFPSGNVEGRKLGGCIAGHVLERMKAARQ